MEKYPLREGKEDIGNTLSAELEYLPFINLAIQQNALPLVRELTLINHSGTKIEHAECVFSSVPGFILEKTISVEGLEAEEERPIHDLGIELDYAFLSSVSEEIKGKLVLELRLEGETVFRREYKLTAFAADQWLGLKFMPELICSFVTPNLSVISQLQSVVADELKKETGSSAIEGYQGDRKRVYEICGAIYRAIHSWGIHYANPAASFGTPGQRIRFADAIRKFHLGTCLDTTVLFASVMEQCGLHPVILLQKGHAYIGCHLVDRYFPDLPMDDLQTIRKLADLDEFLVLETTMVTGRTSFSEAEAAARLKHLNIDGEFQCAIDVIRARYAGIRPLPLKRSENGIELDVPEARVENLNDEKTRDLQQNIDLDELRKNETPGGRIARWTQKLLDLSLRNRLLNVRDTKLVIPVACPDITVLEDKLAANESFTLNPLANLLGEKELHDLAMLRNSEIKTDIKELLEKELQQKRLWTLLTPTEMVKRLTALYRQGKTDQEEGGVNTIFVAVGFLEWKVSPQDERSFLAPILLLPVRLQRASMSEGIRISRIDEDTIINETLLELLRSQFHLTVPGLSSLPTDHSGIDVARVMQIFRQTIKDMPGWEVREEIRLGLFSFGKFVMWTDMTARADALKQNPLVRHLMEGGGLFDDGVEVFPPEEIGQHLDLERLFCPLNADSSQLTAVLYSVLGKSFVLHGPPGTGKSQTITNIIAENLALGRRVLFVSEKRAALEVVHKRLSAVGLRPFCLELHSNKSGKADVLAQFTEALNVQEQREPEEWKHIAGEMRRIRDDLNEYVRELHKKYPNGFSAYDCFARLLVSPPEEDLLEISCLDQTREEYEETKQIAEDLANSYDVVAPEDFKYLSFLDPQEWSPVFEKECLSSAKQLLASVRKLRECHNSFCGLAGCPGSDLFSVIYESARLAETLKDSPDIPEALLNETIAENVQFLGTFQRMMQEAETMRQKYRDCDPNMVRSLDVEGIAARIHENEQSFFLLRFLKNRALLEELSGLKKVGGLKLTIPWLAAALPDFARWNEACAAVEKGRTRAKELLGRFWQDESSDWQHLTEVTDSAGKILDSVKLLTEFDGGAFRLCLDTLKKIMADARRNFAQESEGRNRINDLLLAWNDFYEKRHAFAAFARSMESEKSSRLEETLTGLLNHMSGLRGVMRFQCLRQKAEPKGLRPFISALEDARIAPEDAPEIFDASYARKMLDQILGASRTLARFNGLDHRQRIRKFCELDDRYIRLSRDIAFARLAAALPRRRSGPCPEGTELGLLKRECEKKARQKPVRQLLAELPNLVPILKPCFLMSPLSVAQYLPADTAMFDLIVFDEASQIPVWDAIGVIARGRQLIVVGDPKQMPPTSFFQKGDNPEEDPEPDMPEDMESILDECLAAGLHSCKLNWHYRSRHESLIAFSNHYYYEDRLFTFPAARHSDRLGVRFHFVPDGVYDRRGTRTNQAEARALVRYIFERLENSPGKKKRSIGVVTFSEAQKTLIEDLLEEERARHPDLESWFSDKNEESLFVKNLENVQGDERDVILFSICYAPDPGGKFSMNFGPLNRQGGERRLNVAITRAKEQVVVFSSIHAHQIELARTNAVGAAHLRYFLDYAEKGLTIRQNTEAAKRKNGLASVIETFLHEQGYSTERDVGCSGYRIDLAVKKPESGSGYLLGIEFDGPSYAAQKTTRDRDHLRNDVLSSLGWHIWRAWSVDWFFDRQQAESSLLEALEKAEVQEPDPPEAPEPEEPAVPDDPGSPTPPPPPAEEHEKTVFSPCIISCPLPQESFYETESLPLIREQMREVIRQEAPVCERVLKKRITRAWNFNRAGDNIQRILNLCLPQDLPVTHAGEENVYWNRDQIPAEYREYRVNPPGDGKRTIDEIPPEELSNAMYEILVDFSSCEQDALFRETMKRFGFSAVTQKARKYLELGLQSLKESGRT